MKGAGVYLIKNTVNGKFYVGSSVKLRARLTQHRGDLRAGRHSNKHLQRAFKKHGEEAFTFSVLETVSDTTHLLEREQYWLDLLDAAKRGYNIALVAGAPTLGLKMSEEHKAKMSAAQKGRKGRSPTEEERAAISAKLKGRSLSEETRRKMSESHKGAPFTAERRANISAALKGRKLSAEHCAAMSEANRGKKASEETKRRMSLAQKKLVELGVHNFCRTS